MNIIYPVKIHQEKKTIVTYLISTSSQNTDYFKNRITWIFEKLMNRFVQNDIYTM